MGQRKLDLVVFDFDNTLADSLVSMNRATDIWIDAVIARVASETGKRLDRHLFEADLLARMIAADTNNYPLTTPHLPMIQAAFPEMDAAQIDTVFADISAQYYVNRRATTPFNGMVQTLEKLRANGTRIVVFSETEIGELQERLAVLGIETLIDAAYAPISNHDHVTGVHHPEICMIACHNADHPTDYYGIAGAGTWPKNSPNTLAEIIKQQGSRPEHTAMVGDSIRRDCGHAQTLGVLSLFAYYGHADIHTIDVLARTRPFFKHVQQESSEVFHMARDYCDHVLHHFTDLLQHIRPARPDYKRQPRNLTLDM